MSSHQLSFSNRFFDALNDIEEAQRPKLFDALDGLRRGRALTELHPIPHTGLWAYDIVAMVLRVVCHVQAGNIVLLFVGAPGAANAWAQAHRVVRAGASLRVVPRETQEESTTPVSTAPWRTKPRPPIGPLARYRPRQFARFGIGAAAATVLRRLGSEDEVVELAELMTPLYANVLVGMATDDDLGELERAFQEVQPAEEAPPAPVASSDQIYTPSTEEELRAALLGPPEAWAVFLHPQQRRAVEARTKGAVKVVGGPGTGKSVVAVHRARILAERMMGERPVLLTVFSHTLVEPLQRMVDQLCASQPDIKGRIRVLDLVAVAQQVLVHARRHHRLATPDVVAACWSHALSQGNPLGWSQAQHAAEREHVLGRNGAWSWEAYRDTARHGRTLPLSQGQREQAWSTLHAFEEAMADAGVGDELALMRAAEWVVRDGVVPSPFASVVCDEVQDASAAALRMLSALALDRDARQIRPDGLFLTGDGYQRVYARPVPLSQCGIEVRGRSWTLRVNYRSTDQIRDAALAGVADLEPDVLEAGTEDSKEGYRSEREGVPPERHRFASTTDEARWIARQADAGPLLVVTRHLEYRDELVAAMSQVGLVPRVLEGPGIPDEGITICTLHRAKGLEAPRVVVAGAHQIPTPFTGADESDRAWWNRSEQCLLYVGMTRARDWLAVTAVGAES